MAGALSEVTGVCGSESPKRREETRLVRSAHGDRAVRNFSTINRDPAVNTQDRISCRYFLPLLAQTFNPDRKIDFVVRFAPPRA